MEEKITEKYIYLANDPIWCHVSLNTTKKEITMYFYQSWMARLKMQSETKELLQQWYDKIKTLSSSLSNVISYKVTNHTIRCENKRVQIHGKLIQDAFHSVLPKYDWKTFLQASDGGIAAYLKMFVNKHDKPSIEITLRINIDQTQSLTELFAALIQSPKATSEPTKECRHKDLRFFNVERDLILKVEPEMMNEKLNGQENIIESVNRAKLEQIKHVDPKKEVEQVEQVKPEETKQIDQVEKVENLNIKEVEQEKQSTL